MKANDLHTAVGLKKRINVKELARIIAPRNASSSYSTRTNSNYCLFLGAGASRSSGISTGAELVRHWREECAQELGLTSEGATAKEQIEYLKTHASDWYDENKEYSTLFEHKYRLPFQRKEFIESEIEGKTPSIGYAYLVKLTEKRCFRNIITTNFDDLINEAFYQFSNERPLVCAHDSSIQNLSLNSPGCKIIKLHGDHLFDNIKSTTDETNQFTKNSEEKLSQYTKEYGLVICGYSAGDESVMRYIESALRDQNQLKFGLYWCLRPDSHVPKRIVDTLSNAKAHYVITDGFDSLMADIHDNICGPNLPFNSKIASARASRLIESYLQNPELRKSTSPVITKHIQELERDKNGSNLMDSLVAYHQENATREKITDAELLHYIETERLIKSRRFTEAITHITSELKKPCSASTKKMLLDRLLYCSRMQYNWAEATKATEELLKLEPESARLLLHKCKLLLDEDQRLEVLSKAREMAPYSAPVAYDYCIATVRKLDSCLPTEISAAIKKAHELFNVSIKLDPSIRNPLWKKYYDFCEDYVIEESEKQKALNRILKEHLIQNAHGANTLRLLFRYCELNGISTYEGNSIFYYFDNALKLNFEAKIPTILASYIDACMEFDGTDRLLALLERCASHPSLLEDELYVSNLMDVAYKVYRNVDVAANLGEDFLKRHDSQLIQNDLFSLYLATKRTDSANKMLSDLKGLILESEFKEKEADILERGGKYQDAIDKLKSISSSPDCYRDFTAKISYIYLLMGIYELAYKECKQFLHDCSFSPRHNVEILNYEFARVRMKPGNKVHKEKIVPISIQKKKNDTKAVALYLLGEEQQALGIMESLVYKNYSRMNGYLSWPILENLRPRLQELNAKLIRDRRDTKSSPVLGKFEFINV